MFTSGDGSQVYGLATFDSFWSTQSSIPTDVPVTWTTHFDMLPLPTHTLANYTGFKCLPYSVIMLLIDKIFIDATMNG